MMRLIVLIDRELRATILSFGFWALLALVAGITGFGFERSLAHSGNRLDQALADMQGWLFWLTVILTPLLTMRLLADERRSGSLELLMTAPVSDGQVVVAKYLGAVVVFAAFLVPIWVIHAILAFLFDSAPDWGRLTSMTVGLLGIGLVFLALGILASALTSMQIWAGLLAMLANLLIFAVHVLRSFFHVDSPFQRILSAMSLYEHLWTALSGIVDLRHVVFQLSVVFLVLFWTTRVLESRKWR